MVSNKTSARSLCVCNVVPFPDCDNRNVLQLLEQKAANSVCEPLQKTVYTF